MSLISVEENKTKILIKKVSKSEMAFYCTFPSRYTIRKNVNFFFSKL